MITNRFKVCFTSGNALMVEADNEPEAATIACAFFGISAEDVETVYAVEPNPVEMKFDDRREWFDGMNAVLGLMALLTWMRVSPLCESCHEGDSVDVIDAHELLKDDGGWFWHVTRAQPWCERCIDSSDAVVMPTGRDPHLPPADRAGGGH